VLNELQIGALDRFLDNRNSSEFPLLDNCQENSTYKTFNGSKQVWTGSQRKAFIRLKCGIRAHDGEVLRFLTLTSAPEMLRSIQDVFDCMKTAVKRYTPERLVREGYVSRNKLRKFYPNKNPCSSLKFEYIKIKTSEGNGVLHIPYYGDYLPYNFLCDLFSYYSGFAWDLDIRKVGKIRRSDRDRKKVSYYVINQYVTNQKDENGNSAYMGYSCSWNWIFRGFTAWYNEFRRTHWHLDYDERELLITNYLVNKNWIPPPVVSYLEDFGLENGYSQYWDGPGWDERFEYRRWMNRNCGAELPVGDLNC